MKVRQGPKGKYFTDVVRKIPMRVTIRTANEVIQGDIHIHPDRRALDELNHAEGFLAVTDAVVESNGETTQVDFIAVNKAHIHWVNPVGEWEASDD